MEKTQAGGVWSCEVALPELRPSLNQEHFLASRELARRRRKDLPPSLTHVCVSLSGPLDAPALEAALNEVVRRHPALRISFARNTSLPDAEWERVFGDFVRTGLIPRGLYIQKLAPVGQIELRRHDLRDLEPALQEKALHGILEACAAQFVEDQTALRLQASLIQQQAAQYLLVIAIDHSVSDRWSGRVLCREIEHFYRHFVDGLPAPHAPRLDYLEFTAWQNRALESSFFDCDLAYWEEHWRNFGSARISIKDIPFVRSSSESAREFRTEKIILDPAATASLRASARRSRVTLYVLFQAALLTVLSHYTGRTKIAVWCRCSNRPTPKTMDAIGYFINSHLVGFDLVRNDLEFRNLVSNVAARHREVLDHQQMPLEHLWRTLCCHPRFRDSGIMLDFFADHTDVHAHDGNITFAKAVIERPTPFRAATIGVYVTDHGETLSLRSDYFAVLYAQEGVRNMLLDVSDVLSAFVSNPDIRLSDFPVLAGRYADQPRTLETAIDEYIVLGSARIPSRTHGIKGISA